MASWRLSTKNSRDSAGAIPRPNDEARDRRRVWAPLGVSIVAPTGRAPRRPWAPAPALPQRLRGRPARRAAAGLNRRAGPALRAAPGACVAPELRLRKRASPTAWRAARNPPLRFGSATADSRTVDPAAGAPLRFLSFFFFKSCARRALTRLAKFLFFGKPDNAWGGLGGGKTLGEARGCHGQTIPILAEGHPPSRLTLLFPCAEDAKRGAGSPCCALRIAPKKR